jgi:hypothetical protein
VSRPEALVYRHNDRHNEPATTPTGEPPFARGANQLLGDQLIYPAIGAAFDHHGIPPTPPKSNSERFT